MGGLRQVRVASVNVGGPDMAPIPPTLGAPREPVALLDHPRVAHFVTGSARPARTVGGLSQVRVAHSSAWITRPTALVIAGSTWRPTLFRNTVSQSIGCTGHISGTPAMT